MKKKFENVNVQSVWNPSSADEELRMTYADLEIDKKGIFENRWNGDIIFYPWSEISSATYFKGKRRRILDAVVIKGTLGRESSNEDQTLRELGYSTYRGDAKDLHKVVTKYLKKKRG